MTGWDTSFLSIFFKLLPFPYLEEVCFALVAALWLPLFVALFSTSLLFWRSNFVFVALFFLRFESLDQSSVYKLGIHNYISIHLSDRNLCSGLALYFSDGKYFVGDNASLPSQLVISLSLPPSLYSSYFCILLPPTLTLHRKLLAVTVTKYSLFDCVVNLCTELVK